MSQIQYLLLFVWVGIFFILFLWSILDLYKSIKAYFWPTIQGEIINATISEYLDYDGDLFFTPEIKYRYTIGNLTYQSSRLGYGIGSWAFFWLASGAFMEATKKYPDVVVKYNPRSPGESTVITGLRRFHVANLLIYACFGLMPILWP